jgi:hypothetical protein
MLQKYVWPVAPRTRTEAIPAEAAKAAPPKSFLSCEEGCGLPAQWVLTRLAREPRRADVPVSEALCDACLAKRAGTAS